MLSTYAEKTLAKILSYGAALTAVLVISNSVTDPVNTPKLVSLGVVGAAALGIVLATWRKRQSRSVQISALLAFFFLAAATSATVFSESPLSQNFYGT